MKNLVSFTIAILMLYPFSSLAEEYLSGSFLDKDGIATEISKIRADGKISGKYKGKNISILFSKLKSIEYLGNNMYRVVNMASNSFTIEKAGISIPGAKKKHDIRYYFYDPISMEEKPVDIYDENEVMKTITFSEKVGRLKFNSRTKEYYPPDYVFDPFTGEKLEWKNPEY